jgi:hypothetical protein
MKTLLLSATLAALALGPLPAVADTVDAAITAAQGLEGPSLNADEFDRRGRGRGGRDGGHGGRPRVPGGSGCDDLHDIREHPECRVR